MFSSYEGKGKKDLKLEAKKYTSGTSCAMQYILEKTIVALDKSHVATVKNVCWVQQMPLRSEVREHGFYF